MSFIGFCVDSIESHVVGQVSWDSEFLLLLCQYKFGPLAIWAQYKYCTISSLSLAFVQKMFPLLLQIKKQGCGFIPMCLGLSLSGWSINPWLTCVQQFQVLHPLTFTSFWTLNSLAKIQVIKWLILPVKGVSSAWGHAHVQGCCVGSWKKLPWFCVTCFRWGHSD